VKGSRNERLIEMLCEDPYYLLWSDKLVFPEEFFGWGEPGMPGFKLVRAPKMAAPIHSYPTRSGAY
jgi:hypothetical protein